MSAAASPAGRFSGGEALLWMAAAALALTAHASALAWALRQPPPLAALPAAAPAMIVDLEPATVAPQAPVESLAADSMEAPEVEASMPEIAAAEPPPPVTDLPLVPTLVKTSDALPAVEPPPELPVPVTRPAPRPDDIRVARVEPQEPPPEKVEKKEREPQQASQARNRAASTAPPAEAAAAPAPASGASASVAPAKWQAKLMAHLKRRKKYPAGARKRREEGTVLVRFAIDGQGNVLSAGLVRSSGHTELDQAVLALVQRASPVPAPPPGRRTRSPRR